MARINNVKRILRTEIPALLSGHKRPKDAQGELEELGFLTTSTPNELSQEDQEKLRSNRYDKKVLQALIAKEVQAIEHILQLPDTTSIVVALVMDWICTQLKPSGYLHCTVHENSEIDLITLQVLYGMSSKERRREEHIQVQHDKRDTSKPVAAILPHRLLLDRLFINQLSSEVYRRFEQKYQELFHLTKSIK